MGCASSSPPVRNEDGSEQTGNAGPLKEKQKTYSDSELYGMRKEFWESRVDGIPDIYVALKSVCEAMLNNDSGLADAILQASSITTVDATLARCYDERGHEYNIPSYCWSAQGPVNFKANKSSASSSGPSSGRTAPMSEGNPLVVRVQVNPGDRNFTIPTNSSVSVANLKALICRASTIKTEKNLSTEPVLEARQRMIFMGKELKNSQNLGDIGVDEARVVQVFLRKE